MNRPRIASALSLSLLLLLGASSAQALSTLGDGFAALQTLALEGRIQFDGGPVQPLDGEITFSRAGLVLLDPLAAGASTLSQILPVEPSYFVQDILLETPRIAISGPDVVSFTGLQPAVFRIPIIRFGDPGAFAVTTNVEILRSDGESALVRTWELLGTEVDGAVALDGSLASLSITGEIVERVQIWTQGILSGPVRPLLGELAEPLPLPVLIPGEVISEETIARFGFASGAGSPIPEPHGLLLFATGLAIVELARRRRAGAAGARA